MNLSKSTFWGYQRENGRVGVRNHVVILPVDDLSNAAAQAVENNVKGTLALPHPYGRLQFGADLDLHFRTLIGTGSNPNVAAVIVIGIEDGWTKRVVDGIAKTGKPVVGFGIEGHGDIATIAKASYKAKEFVQWASELTREECDLIALRISRDFPKRVKSHYLGKLVTSSDQHVDIEPEILGDRALAFARQLLRPQVRR